MKNSLLSHLIRNPLAILNANLQILSSDKNINKKLIAECLKEIENLNNVVNTLLNDKELKPEDKKEQRKSKTKSAGKVIVVDDEEAIVWALKETLLDAGYEVFAYKDPVLALKTAQKEGCDVLLTDIKMPEMDGIELIKNVSSINPEIKIIIITAFGSYDIARDVQKYNVFDYVSKPFDINEIKNIVNRAMAGETMVEFSSKEVNYAVLDEGNEVGKDSALYMMLKDVIRQEEFLDNKPSYVLKKINSILKEHSDKASTYIMYPAEEESIKKIDLLLEDELIEYKKIAEINEEIIDIILNKKEDNIFLTFDKNSKYVGVAL